MSESGYQPSPGWRVWGVAIVALSMVIAALWRIKTLLGVEALTEIGTNPDGSPIYDKVGRDAIWRIWWRSRDEFISVDPQWVLTAGLVALLAVFGLALLAAVWIALSPDQSTASVSE